MGLHTSEADCTGEHLSVEWHSDTVASYAFTVGTPDQATACVQGYILMIDGVSTALSKIPHRYSRKKDPNVIDRPALPLYSPDRGVHQVLLAAEIGEELSEIGNVGGGHVLDGCLMNWQRQTNVWVIHQKY